jgi:hypothetical protein
MVAPWIFHRWTDLPSGGRVFLTVSRVAE